MSEISAYHEAGHAFMAIYVGARVRSDTPHFLAAVLSLHFLEFPFPSCPERREFLDLRRWTNGISNVL